MAYGRIRITLPGGLARDYPLDVPSVVVGRALENRIVIDAASVSRRHARLTLDSGRMMVEDLGSSSGTFVNGRRLPPNTPHLVEDGQAFYLGDVEARFWPEGRAAAGPAYAAPAAGAAPDVQQGIVVSVSGPAEPVAPGSQTAITAAVQNRGRIVDEVTLSVVGLPPEWVRVSRPQVPLLPGARDEVTILLAPPHSAAAGAGDHEFAVSALSRETGVEVRAVSRVSVTPFEDLALTLQPSRAKRDFRLAAENRGNAPVALALRGRDEEDSLDFRFAPDNLLLPPGQSQAVRLQVSPRSRKVSGQKETRSFTIEAAPPSGGAVKLTAAGQLLIDPPVRSWKWPLIALLAVAGIGGGAVAYSQVCTDGFSACIGQDKDGNGDDAARVSAGQTATALAAAPTAAGGASASAAAAAASASAAAAASATAAAGASASAAQRPDLSVVSVSIGVDNPGDCRDRLNVGVRIVVRNSGQRDAGPFLLALNGTRKDVPGVLAGNTASLFYLGSSPSAVTVQLDVTNLIDELDERNNTFQQNVPLPTPIRECTPTPTVPSGVTPPPTHTPTPATRTPTPTARPVGVTPASR